MLTMLLVTTGVMAAETLQRGIDLQTLRVGVSSDQAPFNMVNRDVAPMGSGVDPAMTLAAAMRVKPEIKRMPFGELMAALKPIGIAVNATDPQFYDLVDNYLEAYARVGILAKLRAKWFENSDWVAALP